MSRQLKGIDISQWQTGLDYTTMGRSLDFVILREGYRQSRDKLFLTHVNGFKAAGVPIKGVYHFIYALNSSQAKQEAESAVRNVLAAGLPKITYIWADFEYDSIQAAEKAGIYLTPEDCNNFTRIFCETVEKAGYPTGIYTNVDYYNNMYDPDLLAAYPVWLADLRKAPAYPCMVWQYSWEHRIPGYSDCLDADIWYEADAEAEIPTVEKAIRWMEALAEDDSHGYDQIYRWGEKGDYDCSSAVITAWKTAGVPLTCTYTRNMLDDMLRHGFRIVQDGSLKRGDVLLNEVHHVAMYCGDGKEVEASINEKGGAVWGIPGDQTGKEILIRPYRNYPWDYVLRYESVKEDEYMFQTETVRKGSKGASVLLLQKLLKAEGYTGSNGAVLALDSDFGGNTEAALKEYQRKHTGLAVDGICGVNTWKSIVGL